ncbi:unnamed protein product, partial [Lymnaea stagnalis]
SEKETHSSTKVSGLLKSHPPSKKIKNQNLNVKRASADCSLSLNPSTSQSNIPTPKIKDYNTTKVKITSVSSIPESDFSVQVDEVGLSALNKLSNSKNKFKGQNMKTCIDVVTREVTKPNQTVNDQCSFKLEDPVEFLPLTFIKEEVKETADDDNFESETSSELENVTVPVELADASGYETQANEIVTDVIYPTGSVHMPTSPSNGLFSESAAKSFSAQQSPDPNLDSFQMLKTIIKQESEDDFHCVSGTESPTGSSSEGPLEKDSPSELDNSCADSEHSFSANVNGNLNLTPVPPSPQSNGEEAHRGIFIETQPDTAKNKNLVHLENISSTPVAGSNNLFDFSKRSCFEKSLKIVNKNLKTKKTMALVKPSTLEREGSKIKESIKSSTCDCLHTCNISEKPEPPPNFLSCLCKTRQSKENSCHSSVLDDSSNLLGSLSKSPPVIKHNTEP